MEENAEELAGAEVIIPKSPEKELTLRDELAVNRTKLAEERTSLSYIRTGMSLFLGGIFFVGYFGHDSAYAYVGYVTIIAAVMFTIYGFYHNKKSMQFIALLVEEMKKG